MYAVPADGVDPRLLQPSPATGLPYEVAHGDHARTRETSQQNYECEDQAHQQQVSGAGDRYTPGYDSKLTTAGHYAHGYDGVLTAPGEYSAANHPSRGHASGLTPPDGTNAAGYDSQLTDPDYALRRSQTEESTQERLRTHASPTKTDSVNVVPMATGGHGYACDSTLARPGRACVAGYDSQLTDPDDVVPMSRAGRSTQRRPVKHTNYIKSKWRDIWILDVFWSQHLGCWRQNTSRIQHKEILTPSSVINLHLFIRLLPPYEYILYGEKIFLQIISISISPHTNCMGKPNK